MDARGIYIITNTANGNQYVGGSMYMYMRWKSHTSELRAGRHANALLQSDWNRYGEECFICEAVELVDRHINLLATEQKWIDRLRPAYNIKLCVGLNAYDKSPDYPNVGVTLEAINTRIKNSASYMKREVERRMQVTALQEET